MVNPDELEIAKLAAFTSSSLKHVDESLLQRSSNGPANKLDPRKFISQPASPQPQRPTIQLVKDNQFIEPPKSRSVGREVMGTTEVNIDDLMIPIPDDLKDRVTAVQTGKIPQPPTSAAPTVGKIEFEHKQQIPSQYNTPIQVNNLEQRLEQIEKKLNRVIKLLQKNEKPTRQKNMGKKVQKSRTNKTV